MRTTRIHDSGTISFAHMKLFGDLQQPWLIHTKGFLFLFLGVVAAVLLWSQDRTLRTLLLLCVCIWGFCRFYYYLFYVLERYLGREKPFSGVFDALRYLVSSRSKRD